MQTNHSFLHRLPFASHRSLNRQQLATGLALLLTRAIKEAPLHRKHYFDDVSLRYFTSSSFTTC